MLLPLVTFCAIIFKSHGILVNLKAQDANIIYGQSIKVEVTVR